MYFKQAASFQTYNAKCQLLDLTADPENVERLLCSSIFYFQNAVKKKKNFTSLMDKKCEIFCTASLAFPARLMSDVLTTMIK